MSNDFDFIALGTAGVMAVRKAILGSTAESVFRWSPSPVLTVGPHCSAIENEEDAFRTVMFVTDFSAASRRALPYAISMAERFGSQLLLVHVVPEEDGRFSAHQGMARHKALHQLSHMLPAVMHLPGKPECVVSFGLPANVIVAEAVARGVGLIVMGARGMGAASAAVSHFAGGVAYHVAANATCPVLTIRD